MSRVRNALLAAALMISAPAHAATFLGSLQGDPDPGDTGNFVIDFESALPLGITLTGAYKLYNTTIPTRGILPAGDTSTYLSVPGEGFNGSALLDFGGYTGSLIESFSFYWGSIDNYNSLHVLTNFGDFLLTGADVKAAGDGTGSTLINQRVFIGLDFGEQLLGIGMRTGLPAFETDDFVFQTAVPEPASWALLLTGFGLVGYTMRRRSGADMRRRLA